MDKMSGKDQVTTRKQLYEITSDALASVGGYTTEPISTGLLIDLGNGYYAKCSISVCDASKFDLDAVRADYATKLSNQAELAQKRAESAAAKAEKANAAAAKKAAKEAEKAAKA